MSGRPRLDAQVRNLRLEAEDIISVELTPCPGHVFPEFTPGAHIDLHLPNGLVRSYSLCNASHDGQRYVVGVFCDHKGRGGSKWVHDSLRCGMTISISAPRNNFELDESSSSTILIAGGIGVTPILAMYRRLRSLKSDVRLVYCARSKSRAAFLDELHGLGGNVTTYFDEENEGRPADIKRILAQAPREVHAYCCGPEPMLKAFESACSAVGIANTNVHVERFAAAGLVEPESKSGFTVELSKTGKSVTVPPGQSILQALLDAGVDVDHSCEEGVCGACETRVLTGDIEHRDCVLRADQKASNKVMMVCVSRARGDRLVLDL